MKIVQLKTSNLIPYARNNKIHSETQIKKIASSIKEFGWKQPVVVDSGNEIIIGHGRVLAAELLKMEEVPCIIADDLSKQQIKALRISDNKLSDISEWNKEFLSLELEELSEVFDMTNFGFEDYELSETDIDLGDFFEETESQESEQESKKITCPHCGEEVEI